jgi:lysophospholipase L1-like esterase
MPPNKPMKPASPFMSLCAVLTAFAAISSTGWGDPRIPLAEGEVGTAAQREAPPNPAFAKVVEYPSLPRVLIIGDSISVGYLLPARDILQGKANVLRPAANCGSTKTALGSYGLERWLGNRPWDVIHFNFGLHDLSYRFADGKDKNAAGEYASPQNGAKPNVSVQEYGENLRKIVARLKQTGAKLIFATTTPVPDSEAEKYVQGSEAAYNEIARQVMSEEGVAINDLHSLATTRLAELQIPRNVHFTNTGSKALAEHVAASIGQVLDAGAQKDQTPGASAVR